MKTYKEFTFLDNEIKKFQETRNKKIIDNGKFYGVLEKVNGHLIQKLYPNFTVQDKEDLVQHVTFSLLHRLLNKPDLGDILNLAPFMFQLAQNSGNVMLTEAYKEQEMKRELTGLLEQITNGEVEDIRYPKYYDGPLVYVETTDYVIKQIKSVDDRLKSNPYTKNKRLHLRLLIHFLVLYPNEIADVILDPRIKCIAKFLSESCRYDIMNKLHIYLR